MQNHVIGNPSSSVPVPESQRLMSLDVLRGFDMFWILGADAFVRALNRMSPSAPTKFLSTQLEHIEWAGFHFYDLIFPLFVFIMGVSTVFSLTKIIERDGRVAAMKRIVLRSLLLYACGLIYNGGLANPWPDVRLSGVLNSIALCYLGGGLLFCWFKPRALSGIAVALLIGYWAMLNFIPMRDIHLEQEHLAALAEKNGDVALAGRFRAANPWAANPSAIQDSPVWAATQRMYAATTNRVTGKFEMGYNVANHFDFEHLPGRKRDLFWEPEGLLGALPAVVTCLLGIFAGLFIRNKSVNDTTKVFWLIGAGAVGVALGFLWGLQFPVIKKIWSSSFVLVAGGYSAMLLGAFYWIVDVKKWQAWGQPFLWIGMNPITLYLASNFIGGGFQKLASRLAGGSVTRFLNAHVAAGFGDLVVCLVGILLFVWFARFLYQRKIFLRL
ncbi:MAG: heparan-alpha-glucosaminide N-acetyltransferase domain-containing protein [Verrucomicrobiota bacterium]